MLIKLEINTPQNTNEYSLGIELGRKMYLAITATNTARATFDTADTTEAPICKLFVISTLFEILPQKLPISAFVYSWAKFALQ